VRASTALRWCLLLEWVFVLGSVAVSLSLESSLPEPLVTWLNADAERDLSAQEIALHAVLVAIIASLVVATIGLLCLRRWAAWLYLIATVLGMFLVAFTGPTVEHAVADALDDAGMLMSGAVIALAFFTGSLDRSAPEPASLAPLSERG
jgi:hypothetical protein